MSSVEPNRESDANDLRPEYNFRTMRGVVRGKFAKEVGLDKFPMIKSLGLNHLSAQDRAALAHELWVSVSGPPAGIWSEDDEGFEEEMERRDKELDEHPERVVTMEQLEARLKRPQ